MTTRSVLLAVAAFLISACAGAASDTPPSLRDGAAESLPDGVTDRLSSRWCPRSTRSFRFAAEARPSRRSRSPCRGRVLFGPHHLARLDPATGDVTLWPLDFAPGLGFGSHNLHVDSGGDLWLSAGDRLVRLDPTTDQITTWPMTGIAVLVSHALDTQGRPVFGGKVSASSPRQGVGRLDVSSGLPTMWPFTNQGIRGIVVDGSDDVWVNTGDFKIHRLIE